MKRVLIFYAHYFPAYKAGGPVQSLRNMVELIKDDVLVDIVCSATDLGEKPILAGIVPDQWNLLERNVNVFYLKTSGLKRVKQAFRERRPDLVYINGVFLPLYSWLPLWLSKAQNIPVVFAPRGMLQRGAIAGGTAKKKLAIFLMKITGLDRNIRWHATDEQERIDILDRFGENSIVSVVHNVPKQPLAENRKLKKQSGELNLVFLSLIARKKNLHLILTVLKSIKDRLTLDIYGPVKDKLYWQECLAMMTAQKHQIRYRGPVSPADVQATLKNYHCFILLTKGENFGHAIYESLSVGTPVIISQFTPWGQVQDKDAGITADIHDAKSIEAALERFLVIDQKQFNKLSDGAFNLARQYYSRDDFKTMYMELFSIGAVGHTSDIFNRLAVSKK